MEHIGQMGLVSKIFSKFSTPFGMMESQLTNIPFSMGPTTRYDADRGNGKNGIWFLRISRTIWRYHGISNQQCDRWIVRQWKICLKSCSFDRTNDVSKRGFQADFSHKNPCWTGRCWDLGYVQVKTCTFGGHFHGDVLYIWCMYTVT